jgi:hypothetical protein
VIASGNPYLVYIESSTLPITIIAQDDVVVEQLLIHHEPLPQLQD